MTTKAKSPSLRKRAVARIPRKYRVARGAAHVIVGTAVIAGRGVRVLGRGVGRGGKVVGSRISSNVRLTLYGRERAPAVAGKRFRRSMTFTCVCGMSTNHLAEFNDHLVVDHRKEKRSAKGPTIVRRPGGRVIVRPADWAPTGGRHRRPRTRVAGRPRAERIEQMTARWLPRLISTGESSMPEIDAAKKIVAAFADLADTRLPPGMRRSELHDFFCGLERALVHAADELEPLRRKMMLDADSGGLGLDPTIVAPFVKGLQEGLSDMAKRTTRFLMDFEDTYGMHIRAVKNGKTPHPAMDLSA